MTQHNWDEIIAKLRKNPGQEFLVAELVQGGTSIQRLRDAGMEIRKETINSKFYDLYATCPLPTEDQPVTRDTERPGKEHDPDEYIKKAKRLAMDVYNNTNARSMYPPLTEDMVFVVWFSKTLQNWKAMVSTTVPLDSAYFEVTHNGATEETYVDMYFKHSNTVYTRFTDPGREGHGD